MNRPTPTIESALDEIAALRAKVAELRDALQYLSDRHALGNQVGRDSMDATRLDPYIMHIRAALAKVTP